MSAKQECEIASDFGRYLPRRDLVDAALGLLSKGVVVIGAPCGYGKSWLACQLCKRLSGSGVPSVLYVRVTSHSSKNLIVQDLIGGLRSLGHELVDDNFDTLIAFLGLGADMPVVVVDLDGPPPPRSVRSFVSNLIGSLAQCTKLVVACRRPEQLALNRLELLVHISCIGPKSLEFTPLETAQARNLDFETAASWHSIALGWPVACGKPSAADEGAVIDGDSLLDSAVLSAAESYIEREVIGELSNKDAELLQKCSVLEKIEPGVFHALDLKAPWSRLVNVIESGIPTVVTERYCDEIVIHPLVRRYFRRRLRAWAPVNYTKLNSAAAEYFLAMGDTSRALAQVANISDAELVAEVADRAGGWRAALVDGFAPLGISSSFNDELILRHPRTALGRIYWKAQSGRLQEASNELKRLCARHSHLALSADVSTISAVLSIYEDKPVDLAEVAALHQREEGSNSPEPLLELGCDTLLAALHNNAGERHEAYMVATSSVALAERLGSPYVEFYGRWQQALALCGLGRVREANEAYAKLGILADSLFGDSSNEARLVGLAWAHSLILEGRLSEAAAKGDELDELFRLHSWLDVYTQAMKASVALAEFRGGAVHRKAVIEEFRTIAKSRGIARLEIMILLQEAKAALCSKNTEKAQEIISTAKQCCQKLDESWGQSHATIWPALKIEEARLEVCRGEYDRAGKCLEPVLNRAQATIDQDCCLEGLLLSACVAMGRRRLREMADYLTRASQLASESGLLGPMRDPSNYAVPMLVFVNEHAVPIDAATRKRLEVLLDADSTVLDWQSQASRQAGMLLTGRETDVAVLLAEGLSSKEIARRLDIGEGTVRTHRKHLYRKLGVSRRSQAIMRARELRLV